MPLNNTSPIANPTLTAFMQEQYDDKNQEYVADQILPIENVSKYSGNYAKAPILNLQTYKANIANGASAKEITLPSGSKVPFTIDQKGLSVPISKIDLEDSANNTPYPTAEKNASMQLAVAMKIIKEDQLSSALRTSANYVNGNEVTLSGNSQFSDLTNSDPAAVFADAMDTILDNSLGLSSVRAVMTSKVSRALKRNKTLLDKARYVQKGDLTTDDLKSMLEVDEIIIADGFYELDNGQHAQMWGDDIIIYRAPNRMAMNTVSLGFQLRKTSPQIYRWNVQDAANPLKLEIEDDYEFIIDNYKAATPNKDCLA